jgi:hypothetical protein
MSFVAEGGICSSQQQFGDPVSSSLPDYFETDGDTIRVINSRTPSSSSSLGYQGEICWDSNYIYVCISNNTWTRCALSSF